MSARADDRGGRRPLRLLRFAAPTSAITTAGDSATAVVRALRRCRRRSRAALRTPRGDEPGGGARLGSRRARSRRRPGRPPAFGTSASPPRATPRRVSSSSAPPRSDAGRHVLRPSRSSLIVPLGAVSLLSPASPVFAVPCRLDPEDVRLLVGAGTIWSPRGRRTGRPSGAGQARSELDFDLALEREKNRRLGMAMPDELAVDLTTSIL